MLNGPKDRRTNQSGAYKVLDRFTHRTPLDSTDIYAVSRRHPTDPVKDERGFIRRLFQPSLHLSSRRSPRPSADLRSCHFSDDLRRRRAARPGTGYFDARLIFARACDDELLPNYDAENKPKYARQVPALSAAIMRRGGV